MQRVQFGQEPEEPVDAVDGQIQIGSKSFGYDRLGMVRTRAANS